MFGYEDLTLICFDFQRILFCLSVPYKLSLDTVENIMKTSQMVVQGLWCHKSPLLQLPHITEDMLRHFVTKRVS